MSSFTELDWIKEARKHVGLKELNGTNKHPTIDSWAKSLGASWVIGQPWCGTFVAHCLKTGLRRTLETQAKSLLASRKAGQRTCGHATGAGQSSDRRCRTACSSKPDSSGVVSVMRRTFQ